MSERTSSLAGHLRAALSTLLDINVQERLARWGVIGVIVLLPLWIWLYEEKHISDRYPLEAKVFTMTGIGGEGKWTLEEVTGYNHWWKSFPEATIVVEQGDVVVIRLKSADVTHIFYAPTLDIGPIQIEPGYVQEVTFVAHDDGVHEYYCLSVCGDCHFYMKGKIIVGSQFLKEIPARQPTDFCAFNINIPEPKGMDLYRRGKFLFQKMGCITCHGAGGMGGKPNPNYVKGTVPALNTLARTLSLVDEEAVNELVRLIEEGNSVDEMNEIDTRIPRQSLVLAKYRTVRNVIKEGRPIVARNDTTSFGPPLTMPSWGEKLSEREIDALIVYLVKQQSWEDANYVVAGFSKDPLPKNLEGILE